MNAIFTSSSVRFASYEIELFTGTNLIVNFIVSSCKHVRVMYTPLHPTLYSKTGVNRVKHYFLSFALKHRLWVHVMMIRSKGNICCLNCGTQ